MDPRISKYADLIVKYGVNLQKGQTLLLTASVEASDFAHECVRAAYEAGCREVEMRWTDDFSARQRFLYADNDIFDSIRSWKADQMNTHAIEDSAFLFIDSDDPEALSGVDPDRILRSSRISGEALKPFRERETSDVIQWCIAAYPGKAWAKKVFPELNDDDAVSRLLDAILATMRVTRGNDPITAWKAHNDALKSRVTKLNSQNFKYLKYKNSLGTDLTVELPEGHYWDGGRSHSAKNVEFNANMPTEEVFTVPKKDGVNGVAFAAKPLSINGDIAENFSFTFENGKIVKIDAEKGKELLENAVNTDEGSSYLGEVALVPYDSPISQSGILFYNTLFDENASCHLAFGDSYPLIEGGAQMSKEERAERGLNESVMHVDFMIGTPDLSITGVTHDGKEVPVFENGNFAI